MRPKHKALLDAVVLGTFGVALVIFSYFIYSGGEYSSASYVTCFFGVYALYMSFKDAKKFFREFKNDHELHKQTREWRDQLIKDHRGSQKKPYKPLR